MKDVEFQEIEARAAAERARQLTADYGNENAGRDTGRMARFLPGEASAQEVAKKRRKERSERFLNELQRMLADPAYAKRYHEFGDLLDRATDWAAVRKSTLLSGLADARSQIEDMLERAARLEDGRRVFRQSDGSIIDENMNPVSEAEVGGVIWPADAPDGDAYVAQRRRREMLEAELEAHEAWEVDVLGRARDRYQDTDNPITPEEMDSFEHDMNARMNAVPGSHPQSPGSVDPRPTAGAPGGRLTL